MSLLAFPCSSREYAASARVEDMGVAAYSRELQGKASNDKEFPFSY